MVAAAMVFAACSKDEEKKNNEPTPTTLTTDPTTIDAAYTAGTYAINVTSNTTWTATVNSGATWCAISPKAGNENGMVTINIVANSATATRTVTITFTADTLIKTVVVTQATTPPISGPPPHAASAKTWVFGNDTWSDRINVPTCNKTAFSSGSAYSPKADCRSYTYNGSLYYYYSWPYVSNNASQLCPNPWRVPTDQEIFRLSFFFNGRVNEFILLWGLPGAADGTSMVNVGTAGYLWAEGVVNKCNETGSYGYEVKPGYGSIKNGCYHAYYGFQVRCVR